MNKNLLLHWILLTVEEMAEQAYNSADIEQTDLEELLFELNNQRPVSLPKNLPNTPEKMIPVLREHFKDNVTLISLVLNHHFPEQYLFYRVSVLEPEIFTGLQSLSEIVPEFAPIHFQSVGRTGFSRYETLNQALIAFANIYWPDLKRPQSFIAYLLYQVFGTLFIELDDYRRYWVMATTEDYFKALDEDDTVTWSGRKEMQTGDYVFMYRASPRSAITDLFRVAEEPLFDPWGGWQGYWVALERVCTVPDIPFAKLKGDDVLGSWSSVRKNFNGTITEPVPPVVYNRLLDFIPAKVKKEHQLEPEKVLAGARPSGQFVSEAEFEVEVITPLLRQWKFNAKPQYPCYVRVGGQVHTGWVDFLVSDEQGLLTLFENKRGIIDDKDLRPAVEQAKSYALHLGLPSFVVAAPEGFWLYALEKNSERLVKAYLAADEVDYGNLKQQLLDLRAV